MGIILTPENVDFSEVCLMDEIISRSFLEEYSESLKRYPETARNSLNIFDKKGRGSNVFGNILASRILGLPLASPSQLEHAVRLSPNTFRGIYVEPALVLRTLEDNYNARNLYSQLEKRNIKPTEENPVRISLNGLDLKEDSSSYYGLIHILTGEEEILQDERFSSKYDRRKFLTSDERGVPIFLTKGEIEKLSENEISKLRTFYARKRDLDWLYLDWDLDLDSGWYRNLAYSNPGGRVALAKKFSSGNIGGYLSKLSKERDKQIRITNERYKRAVEIMNE